MLTIKWGVVESDKGEYGLAIEREGKGIVVHIFGKEIPSDYEVDAILNVYIAGYLFDKPLGTEVSTDYADHGIQVVAEVSFIRDRRGNNETAYH